MNASAMSPALQAYYFTQFDKFYSSFSESY